MTELDRIMREWRQRLHRYPETAFEEKETAAFVEARLLEMGYDVQTGVGKTGVVATLKNGTGTKTIGLRADMDAINLSEQGTPSYRSVREGKMHGCGHDGHIATLLGAAKLLAERKNFNGTVRLLFQPAEEPGKGARAMLDTGLLGRFPVDEIYGFHNMPSLQAGHIYTRMGGIMASEDNFTITIHGRGGHASSPHLGVDPLVVAAQIILALQAIPARSVNPVHPVVISCTELHTDGAHNAIPSNVIITGDTRSTSPEDQVLLEERMRKVCEGICAANGANCEFVYTHEFSPTVNHEECVRAVVQAAVNVVGLENVDEDCEPLMGSEDFGEFLKSIPGCFVFLGSGRDSEEENVPLHNAWYDYNDEVLLIGAEFLAELVHERLTGV